MAASEPDIQGADRGEPVSLMAPLLITEGSRHRRDLADLAIELTQKSAGFRRSLPPSLLASLAGLVRAMNCYYSNLIDKQVLVSDSPRAPLRLALHRQGADGSGRSVPRG